MAGLKYDPIASRVLSALFSRPDVQVVISATFRKIHTRESALEHLKERGIICTLHEDWRTDVKDTRSEEVYDWLQRHGMPDDYLMIDDEDCLPHLDPEKYIQGHPYEGLLTDALVKLDKLAGIDYGHSLKWESQRRLRDKQ
ncbi:hypothetical protein D3C85_992440 [compost metagenome]